MYVPICDHLSIPLNILLYVIYMVSEYDAVYVPLLFKVAHVVGHLVVFQFYYYKCA